MGDIWRFLMHHHPSPSRSFQMESSRNIYALGTSRLVTFLDEITANLQATSPAHLKLIDATKEELNRVNKRTKRLEMLQHGRLSLDGNNSLMSRAESMPGKLCLSSVWSTRFFPGMVKQRSNAVYFIFLSSRIESGSLRFGNEVAITGYRLAT